jgi:hypothetical protein
MLCGEPAMPEFTTVPVQEAQIRTIPGRQGMFMNEYIDYIQHLPRGQAGRLRSGEHENPPTIRRRLISAAKALGIHIIIKRSGNDLYFWREDGGEAQLKTRRGRRPRTEKPGSLIPPNMLNPEPAEDRGSLPSSSRGVGGQEEASAESTPLDQAFVEIE